ncbi:unnamed protein product [Ectocarpus fasciculatus]
MALYTLNSHRRWIVQDRREYDEPTVLNWIAGERASRSSSGSNSARLGYPSQSGATAAAASSGSSADQQGSRSPDYPVNNGRRSPGPAPPAHPADYPSQHSHAQQPMRSANATMSHLGGGSGGGGGGGGTWATPAPPAGPSSSFAHGGGSGGGSRSPEAGGTVVGGVLVRGGRGDGGGGGGGGGGSAEAILVGPLPVLPSTFVVGKGEGDGFGDEADSLVLRRPSTTCSANGGGGSGSADSGRGRREEQAGEDVAVTANNSSHGRLGRVGRWRGGGRGAGAAPAAAPERRQSGGDSGRRPLELSPGMEVLQSWLHRS